MDETTSPPAPVPVAPPQPDMAKVSRFLNRLEVGDVKRPEFDPDLVKNLDPVPGSAKAVALEGRLFMLRVAVRVIDPKFKKHHFTVFFHPVGPSEKEAFDSWKKRHRGSGLVVDSVECIAGKGQRISQGNKKGPLETYPRFGRRKSGGRW